MFLQTSPRIFFSLLCLIAAAMLPLLQACKGSNDSAQPPAPWVYTSEQARYELTLPPEWNREEDHKALNSFADFGANLDNSLHIIVIPQKLPTFPVPDARAVKSAGMEVMQKNIADIHLKRQGDITLDGVFGVSIFFEGTVESERIHYIATYITHAGWGYQIIAWSPQTTERRLIEEVDQILTGWRFLDRENLPSEPSVAEVQSEAQDDSDEQKILNALESVDEQPESSDSPGDDSDQIDDDSENNDDSSDSNPLANDNFSEGN